MTEWGLSPLLPPPPVHPQDPLHGNYYSSHGALIHSVDGIVAITAALIEDAGVGEGEANVHIVPVLFCRQLLLYFLFLCRVNMFFIK